MLGGFVGPALEHGEGPLTIVGDRGIDDRLHLSEHNLTAVVEDRIDVDQRTRVARHAARCWGISKLGATCHGSRISMRLIGCVATRSST